MRNNLLVTIEQRRSIFDKASANARLFFSKLEIKYQDIRISSLKRAVFTLEEKYKDVLSLHEKSQSDLDVLRAIGVDRREDGAWVFDFRVLLERFEKKDINDLKKELGIYK